MKRNDNCHHFRAEEDMANF